MKRGYFCLWRKDKSDPLWEPKRPRTKYEAWLDLRLRAKGLPGKDTVGYSNIPLERGQFIFTFKQLAEEWRWSRDKVRRFLGFLEKDGRITVSWSCVGLASKTDTHNDTPCHIGTICNYDKYNPLKNNPDTRADTKPTLSRHPADTYNKELNKEKGKENKNPCVEVINYLNELRGPKSRLNPTAKLTVKLISTLLSKDHTVEDIKLVIDYKWEEGGDDPYKYASLTPERLFGPTFFAKHIQGARQWASDVEAVGKHCEGARRVLRHLNETCGRAFRESPANLDFIAGWLSKGYDHDDLKMVIDHKWREWGEKEEMEKYVRPATLFGSKFPTYLEEALEADARPEEELEFMADGAGRT